jgi:DNA-binding response OmpR family regulator
MQTDLSTVINSKRRLLIFEEEGDMKIILSEVLMPEKFQLEFVSKDAMDEINHFEPELILLDHISAPQLKEENYCKKIKRSFPKTPLIVISAYPLNNFGSYNNHMDLFIAKPFDLNYFLKCVDSYLIGG